MPRYVVRSFGPLEAKLKPDPREFDSLLRARMSLGKRLGCSIPHGHRRFLLVAEPDVIMLESYSHAYLEGWGAEIARLTEV